MIYLKKFEEHSQYEEYMGGGEVFLPNVSYCAAQNEVHYNPLMPSEPKALKFTTEEPTAYLMIYGVGDTPNLEYSTDGSSWTNITYQAAPEDVDLEYMSFARFGKDTPIYLRGDNPNGLSEMTEEMEPNKVVLLTVVNDDVESTDIYDIQPVEYACSGNIMHLLSYTEDLTAIPCMGCFYALFASMVLPNLITSAPELPATSLTEYCYSNMFVMCPSLVNAPSILPAVTLTEYCYLAMFAMCTNLTSAPELPATTLTEGCYSNMFNGCTSLNYIKVGAHSWDDDYASDWVEDVSPIGAFEIPSEEARPIFYRGEDCIPASWCIKWSSTETPPEPLKISVGNTAAKLCFEVQTAEYGEVNLLPELEYSNDGENEWTLINFSQVSEYGWRSANEFDNDIYIRGNNPSGLSVLTDDGVTIRIVRLFVQNQGLTEGVKFRCSGNVMGLLSCTDGFYSSNIPCSSCFVGLFASSSIIDASELSLPATTLYPNCYQGMFMNCTSLTTAPSILPSTTLYPNCYQGMFTNCTSLTTMPELPATQVGNESCWGMFAGCTSLVNAPELPATTLAEYCYQYMFQGCTSLTTAPELPATELADACYYHMFEGCTSLTTAPELPATELANACYSNMFRTCISLTAAPELPAIVLKYNCYNGMFFDCISLNYVKCLAEDTSERGCVSGWLDRVSSTGTFVKKAGVVYPSYSIPEDWTVEEV